MSKKKGNLQEGISASFLLEADRDYIVARLVTFAGPGFSARAGYLGQQALEKYLKAVSTHRSGLYLKTHNLKELAAHCAQFDADFADSALIGELTTFDDFIEVGRYGAAANYDPHAPLNVHPDIEVRGVVPWRPENRRLLDGLVHVIRGKLDFSTIGYADNLAAIHANDRNNFLVQTWTFPIPIKDVLTHENAYFR